MPRAVATIVILEELSGELAFGQSNESGSAALGWGISIFYLLYVRSWHFCSYTYDEILVLAVRFKFNEGACVDDATFFFG